MITDDIRPGCVVRYTVWLPSKMRRADRLFRVVEIYDRTPTGYVTAAGYGVNLQTGASFSRGRGGRSIRGFYPGNVVAVEAEDAS